MSTLYVIGNGFDLHHGLDTSYTSFGFFLQEHDDDIYDLLVQYFELSDIDPDNPDDKRDPLWSHFEDALATMDYKTLLEDHSDLLPNYGSDDFREADRTDMEYAVGEIVDDVTKNLRDAFGEFIRDVAFPDDIGGDRITLHPASKFMQFNYTDTLERYYGVRHEDIFYVHNSARADDELVLGHGVDPNSFREEERQPPAGLTDEQLIEWREEMAADYDHSFDLAEQRVFDYYRASHKSTAEIIEANLNFFESLADVDEIFVLGHSLGDVDMPYFEKIAASIRLADVAWTVSYHADRDRDVFLNKMLALGVPANKINLIKLNDLRPAAPTLF